ncbi:hypothetical protein TEA_024604 [Camellia sinensis var. sinensis]|uniref:MINDY deubiquitinase domain-containing protein n=1 Tax=Camellia sinensis var. sinensis TaxID=542762 RepID=A0A4S4DZN6_CAMSN|nr:hypothetical protein TEA_024604 [Camellia sinensis var. sinensis]
MNQTHPSSVASINSATYRSGRQSERIEQVVSPQLEYVLQLKIITLAIKGYMGPQAMNFVNAASEYSRQHSSRLPTLCSSLCTVSPELLSLAFMAIKDYGYTMTDPVPPYNVFGGKLWARSAAVLFETQHVANFCIKTLWKAQYDTEPTSVYLSYSVRTTILVYRLSLHALDGPYPHQTGLQPLALITTKLDYDTANAIGSKSYNTLMEELVALVARSMEGEQKMNSEEDSVDFAAATTATLGVPSPCLSRGKSFDSPRAISDDGNVRKGDIEEEAELKRILELSEAESLAVKLNGQNMFLSSNESAYMKKSEPVLVETLEGYSQAQSQKSHQHEPSLSLDSNVLSNSSNELVIREAVPREADCSKTDQVNHIDHSTSEESGKCVKSEGVVEESIADVVFQNANAPSDCFGQDLLSAWTTIYADREPMYEGEVVLAEQVGNSTRDAYDASSKDEITPRQGELIESFLKNNASQLTVYGLFCLLDGLKERELCVFFRNNHFNTMFKFNDELYILATDQGYISQPDLVWEKLNEVNGNTLFMTGHFKEFNVESRANSTWDEQNAMASTADYLASVDNAAHVNSSFNSDLQLAIALQQQEFEQQPQQQPQQLPQPQPPKRIPQQSSVSGSSGLVVGPQVRCEFCTCLILCI